MTLTVIRPSCLNCGMQISDKYDIYIAYMNKKKKELYGDMDPNKVEFKDNMEIDTREIFELLGLNRYCCRMTMTTQNDFLGTYSFPK